MKNKTTAAPTVTRDFLIQQLKTADWKYEFSDDISRQKMGQKKMQHLEESVFEFYKKAPREAVELWNTHSPCGANDVTIVPEFIVRLDRMTHKKHI